MLNPDPDREERQLLAYLHLCVRCCGLIIHQRCFIQEYLHRSNNNYIRNDGQSASHGGKCVFLVVCSELEPAGARHGRVNLPGWPGDAAAVLWI